MKKHNQSQSPVHSTPLHTGTGWGGVFFFHHLKTAWRNLLKYKTQNIISIACLAVGVVCFAVVFQAGTGYLRNLYYTKYDTGRPIFHFYEMTEEEYKNYTPSADNNFKPEPPNMYITDSFVEKLYNLELPAMRELHGYDT